MNLSSLPEFKSLLEGLKRSQKVLMYGTAPAGRAVLACALFRETGPFIAVCRDEKVARTMADDFTALSGQPSAVLPFREPVFHEMEGVSRQFEQQRLKALYLHAHQGVCLFTTADALMLRTVPKDLLSSLPVKLEEGGIYESAELSQRLAALGYRRTAAVEGPGQFSVRGEIFDVFPAGEDVPVRADFYGDEIDTLNKFDILTQRSTERVKECILMPTREVLCELAPGGEKELASRVRNLGKKYPAFSKQADQDAEKLEAGLLFGAADRYIPEIYPFASALDHTAPGTPVLLCESQACMENAESFEFRLREDISSLLEQGVIPGGQREYSLSQKALCDELSSRPVAMLDSFLAHTVFEPDEMIPADHRLLPGYGGSMDAAVSDVQSYISQGYTVEVWAGGVHRKAAMEAILRDHGVPLSDVPVPSRACVSEKSISSGLDIPAAKQVILAEGEQKRQKRASRKNRDPITSFSDLNPGDLVVHDHHGIGRFVGVERIVVDKVWRDYIKIAFQGSDFLYVPATSLHLISKYIGGSEDRQVPLNKLSGTAWQTTRARAKKAAADMAERLAALYAARRQKTGFVFAEDDDLQASFEESFPYDETEDQLVCSREIKGDMISPYPMDRLLCGDVGFGKTEVAFRAVMKAILSGKQAAMLVPTTVLCSQHFATAVTRFQGYPVKIEMISRYRTKAQIKQTLDRVRTGRCDLLIGTHRLLQKDVIFKDLGLLVVDEEQRFGVSHKEKIKEISRGVDVLTLTATPIPRTLNMALSGIRDISVLEEAPLGRHPIQTYVLEYNQAVIFDAIRKELARGGQVYYLHNFIETIDRKAADLAAAFPDARVAAAHGRMNEEDMSEVLGRVYSGDVDILVCTTIIETGVDIPNVNTLIIEDADRYGLAQLHQIRGRVGRSFRRAVAYLTYRRGKVLSETASKRLSAVREFSEFGSGFKIAMRDLEIRGAGNVLGAEQSGHMASVGYEMYLRLLAEASREISGEQASVENDCAADIKVSAGLPDSYVYEPAARIDLYRRIARISSREDWLDMRDELMDRFGEMPRDAVTLLDIALLRADASRRGVTDISQRESSIVFSFRPECLPAASRVCGDPRLKGRMLLSPSSNPYFSCRLRQGDDVMFLCRTVIDAMSESSEQ